MTILDCHCHLSMLPTTVTAPLIQAAPTNKRWVLGGYDPKDWRLQLELKKKHPEKLRTAFGLHPWYVKSEYFELDRDFEQLKELIFQADLVGEIGLDFSGDSDQQKKQLQHEVFERQLSFGGDRPYAFHIVQAHGAALTLLKDYSLRGFVHSFSGSVEVAEKYFAEGILLSFGPSILNENFKRSREALEALPLEAILIESDFPSAEAGQDANKILMDVATEVAKIKSVDRDQLFHQVESNFNGLFIS